MTHWQQLSLLKVEQCYQIAEQQLKRSFPRPEISFKLRGKSAGMAHLQLNKIRLNAEMLEDNQQAFIDEVVPHEICHLLCYQRYGRVKPHGQEWQSLMLNLYQVQPRATHKFTVTSKPQTQIDYECECGIIKLGIRRHNKVVRNLAQYRCKTCLQILNLKTAVER